MAARDVLVFRPWVAALLLRSPLHRLLSGTIMLLSFSGRSTGRRYTTPVSYVRDGDVVTVFTRARWWENLRGGAPVQLVIQGHTLAGVPELVMDPRAVEHALAAFVCRIRRIAWFYGVRFDAHGNPAPASLAAASLDAVMIRIRLLPVAAWQPV